MNISFLRRSKVLVPVFSLFLFLLCGNMITAGATDENVFQFVGRKAHSLYFNIIKYIPDITIESDPNSIEFLLSMTEIDSFEEAERWMATDLLEVVDIPDNMQRTKINMFREGLEYCIKTRYTNIESEDFISVSLRSGGSTYGGFAIVIDNFESEVDELEINDMWVRMYKNDDTHQAIFEYNRVLYIVETNMGQIQLENIIEEMR